MRGGWNDGPAAILGMFERDVEQIYANITAVVASDDDVAIGLGIAAPGPNGVPRHRRLHIPHAVALLLWRALDKIVRRHPAFGSSVGPPQ